MIKIDHDEGVNYYVAIQCAARLIVHNNLTDEDSVTSLNGIVAKITQKSKAGNIFIHVSKAWK